MKRILSLTLMAAALVGLITTCSACSVGAKRTILAEALDDREDREEYFEAILRVLDENPNYVDQFFVQARSHEPTLDRFIMNAAHNLDDEELAKMTAKHLVDNPAGLRQILVESLRASEHKPDARQAIAGAIGQEVELATGIMTDDPEVVRKSMLSTVRYVMKKPEARTAFVQAMYGASPALANILEDNPKVLSKMFQELATKLSDDPELLAKLLGALGDGSGSGESSEDVDEQPRKQPTAGSE